MMCVQNIYVEYVLDVGCWNKPQRFSIRTMTGGVFMENPQTTSSMWMLMNVGVVSRGRAIGLPQRHLFLGIVTFGKIHRIQKGTTDWANL